LSTSPTISFIGAGNMASAIIGGMLDNGYKAGNIWVSAPDDAHLQTIRKRFGVSPGSGGKTPGHARACY